MKKLMVSLAALIHAAGSSRVTGKAVRRAIAILPVVLVVLLAPCAAQAADLVVFGPVHYERTSGDSNRYTGS